MEELWPYVLCFFAALARASGMIAFIPGIESVERGALTFGMSIVLWNGESISHLSFAHILFELFVGFLTALPVLFASEAVQFMGECFDLSRGQTAVCLFDPSGGQSSLCTVGARVALWSYLAASGVLMLLFRTAVHGANALPLGIFANAMPGFEGGLSVVTTSTILIVLYQETILSILLFLFPLFTALALVELFSGLIERLLPEWRLAGEAQLLKTATGFYLLLVLGPWVGSLQLAGSVEGVYQRVLAVDWRSFGGPFAG